jgi:uncharacterized protein
MVIAIFQSLEGESLEDFGIRLAEQWRIGRKELDNGVILLVFIADRRLRMEVGYGLEPVLPDAEAGRIIREVVAPRFREQRWAEGLQAAVDAVFARIAGEPTPPPAAGRGGVDPWTLALLGVFGVVVLILAAEVLGAGRRARRQVYSTRGRGWHSPTILMPPPWGSRGGGWRGGGGFSGGGGRFGGGGASGSW